MFLSRVRELAGLSAVRLTLSLLLVFAFVVVIAWGGTYWLVGREVNRLADARLTAQLDLVVRAIEQGADLPAPGFGQEIAVVTGAGTRGRLPFPMPDGPDGIYLYDQRGLDFRYLIHTAPEGSRIIISENAERQDELLETLRAGLQFSLIAVLVAGVLAGLWFARRAQRRLDLIRDGLANVAQGQLETRIHLPGRPDDLSILADRINVTTGRLEQSMEQMRVQSSNIAHDLRTPLARLRAGIESSLIGLTEQGRPVEADALGSALEQIDRIVGTFNALLRLSRLESGAGRDGYETVDLGALARQIAETYAPVVEDAGQQLNLDIADAAGVAGDRDLLVQLAANLIQNALRHGSPGQDITMRVHGSVLRVVDQGPGIPLAEREKVLQPLYQLEKARQSDGYGLGLSMVAAISALHGASLGLSDGHGGRGLAVTVRFPKLTDL